MRDVAEHGQALPKWRAAAILWLPGGTRAFAWRHSWKLVIGTFGFLAILIGLFSAHTVTAASERREAEQWHTHALEVLLLAEEFRRAAFDTLRGERGYLLTRNPDFLEPYVAGRSEAPRLLRRLEWLVRDNSTQLRNAAAIRSRLHSYLQVLDQTVAFERQGAHADALAVVKQGHGKREFEQLQDVINALEAEERGLLIARREALASYANRNDDLGLIAAGIILALLAVAALAAVSAFRAQARAAAATEELRRLATVDDLTGLPNRRHFMAHFEKEMARARRDGSQLCLATLDIDHFKRINDTHGHPAGDAVLRQISAIIHEKIRLEDSAARLGGEEFALLLPHTSPHQAHLVCERLRAAVASRLFELPEGGVIRVTLSTGVAVLTASDDCETLMSRSDEALYEAKARGRNQVRLAA